MDWALIEVKENRLGRNDVSSISRGGYSTLPIQARSPKILIPAIHNE